MVLRASPFSNGFLAAIHALGWALIVPGFWYLDRVLAVCKSTTKERRERQGQECYLHPLNVFLGSIFFLLFFLLTAPLAFLGFLLWAPLQACRRPFSYHRAEPTSAARETNRGFELTGMASFTFASANLCLLTDGLARFNNLGHTQHRAYEIGKRISESVGRAQVVITVESPSSCGPLSPSDSIIPRACSDADGDTEGQPQPGGHHQSEPAESSASFNGVEAKLTERSSSQANSNESPNKRGQSDDESPAALISRRPRQQDEEPWEVSSLFPASVDILCLEEVFDKRAAKKLTRMLKPLYGHILYDVGVYACQPPCRCSAFKFFNSGLFLASRFPVLEAEYHCFPNSKGEDALAAKGLLSTKMLIGQNQKKKKVVGYFNCTHLHAPEGEGKIRCDQLDMVNQWIRAFQDAHRQPDEEVVFDVLCGDFNFDNCSPDDVLEQNHKLFEEYRDPCRAGPGKEKPWVIGTLLEQPTLYEDDVSSPEKLQRTLETEEMRKQYISPPVAQEGVPLVYPEPGQPWIGRRIDYILYRETSISKLCRTELEEVTFITQLAGLTDHIPVGLRLKVIMDSEFEDE
ncbi:PREDICTED: sphingomyelin phosphodiesterase 3-like [Cyprinodon variegatus]|uniref:sphingomyelin phosphodiesterase n=1 Tax=Cyprinodon variegatus TaxID=28743 RepID=A0A3Q2E2G6_CYPVA|nr:PREDICTED: sphingomyelin phosphodiesterase 3-like [Cyprinodon variegatus]